MDGNIPLMFYYLELHGYVISLFMLIDIFSFRPSVHCFVIFLSVKLLSADWTNVLFWCSDSRLNDEYLTTYLLSYLPT